MSERCNSNHARCPGGRLDDALCELFERAASADNCEKVYG
jgi:hypothetical protein